MQLAILYLQAVDTVVVLVLVIMSGLLQVEVEGVEIVRTEADHMVVLVFPMD